MMWGLNSQNARRLGWLSPLSFAVFLSSMRVFSALPLDSYHSAVAAVEWTEMVVGTVIALTALLALIWESRRVADPAHRMNKALAITGSALWAIFWIIVLGVHPGGG